MIKINDENDLQILKRAEEMLDTTFNWNITDDDFKGWLNEDELYIIDELCTIIDVLHEKIEDMEERHEEEIRENYRPISKYEFYGVNEHDF